MLPSLAAATLRLSRRKTSNPALLRGQSAVTVSRVSLSLT